MLTRLVLVAALALGPAASLAAPTACPQHVAGGEAPTLVNEKLAAKTREVCYVAFAVLHSGVTRTPLWSAEHLTRARVAAGASIGRRNTFHAEPRLPRSERAEIKDYSRSGFDRGHLTPSDDMPDERSQHESFSLANMVPQNPENNRILWKSIESAVRNLARRDDELYVVTGPIFQGATLQRLKGRVLVPTSLFKAVYDPKRQAAGAYVVPNAPGAERRGVSTAELQHLTGIDVFPGLPPEIRGTPMALPEPHVRRRRS
jgi:endonuclease G, mitochondrial